MDTGDSAAGVPALKHVQTQILEFFESCTERDGIVAERRK
jgi:hypothetical protein